MNNELEGQTAIVTGAGRGIGAGIALALTQAGAAVTVVSRTASQVEEIAGVIEKNGGRALPIAADVKAPGAFEEIFEKTVARFGPVDLLVNNAGVNAPLGKSWEVDLAAWRETIDINLMGPFRGMRAVLPRMLERGSGRIVNVVSSVVINPMRYSSAYSVSKAALNRLTELVSLEVEGTGVTMFNLDPGRVHTGMADHVDRWRTSQDWLPPQSSPSSGYIPVEAPVSICLLLASGAVDALSGRFLSVHDDMQRLLEASERVEREKLFRTTINKL